MLSDIETGTHSLLLNLTCPECGTIHNAAVINTVCVNEACKSTLFAKYDLSGGLDKAILSTRPATMWRYKELLPVIDERNIVTLGEGFTPIIPIENLKQFIGDNAVFWKDESGNPTGSFKARGLSAAVSKAKELGIDTIATPTAGNAGGALAAYAARADIKAIVYMPIQTPQVFKDECRLYCAELIEIDGNISDCGRLVNEQALLNNWFQVSTLKEPYRLEGKKTMGYEIAEQFNWQLPDVILYPTGGGTGLIGMWKAFDEMEQLGWIGSKRPRMVAVQSESCNGIVSAFNSGQQISEFTDGGFTIANGLRVPKPYADKQILKVLRDSNGAALTINDAEMNAAVKEIARNEGMLIAPEGAALWQAFKKLKSSKWIQSGETVLMINTGSGYKYLENLLID
ncbi:threonine synthase [Mucilaginibacter sp. BJC16-A38]|uniref:threonine synthase n=1 Tax=Mucilaginibacter phenanthrenivorans TaxID=1234842 RepID=UPI002157D1E5|nr:threonine synthase [Mucilaginibacter phenanthrenivorans]MCR8559014.1 threonine synthase [Mucilaginibacter phenanthrenivorans]